MNEKKKRNCNRNCAATNLRLPFMVCYAQWRLHSSWILLFLLSPQLAKATTKWSQNVSCGERRPQSGEKENTNSSLLLFFLLVRPSLISYYLSLYSGLTREKIREERVCTHMCESVSDEIVAQISSCLSLFSFVLGDNSSLRSYTLCFLGSALRKTKIKRNYGPILRKKKKETVSWPFYNHAVAPHPISHRKDKVIKELTIGWAHSKWLTKGQVRRKPSIFVSVLAIINN